MQLDKASQVEQLCWSLRQADWPRADDRARIQALFNGVPPYTDEEVNQNGIAVNVNYLESTRLSHDARSQYYGAFLKAGNYFECRTDAGAVNKRAYYASVVTKEINKVMKRNLVYFETMRSKFASLVLHGIAPVVWDNKDTWCPDSIGVGDALLPARTYLTMKNLPFIVFSRSYTVPELKRLTRGPRRDPAWNMPLVNSLMEWVDTQTRALLGTSWPEIWSTEKLQERIKGDGGFYTSDNTPTIDVFDVYVWDDSEGKSGWERRMIVDRWTNAVTGGGALPQEKEGMRFCNGKFLYNPGRRKFCDKLSQACAFSFADLSAASPLQYHSVRSLGFLLYAVCTIQNRLRCKFTESVFENLMMLMRVKTMDEVERALKIMLINRGFIDETVQFVPQAERHNINTALVELGLNENSRLINENAQSYRAMQMQDNSNKTKTKAQVMTELNATTALVQAGLMQAYMYQKAEFREIFNRFMRAKSKDAEVREARAAILKQGVPSSVLNAEAWEQEPVRVMGAGNKALELEIAQQLLGARQLFDPDPQRLILRDWTMALTDDPARATLYVPEKQNQVTDSVHDAQLSAGSLMAGVAMGLKQGVNHAEYAGTLLKALMMQVQKIMKRGGVATPDELMGLQNIAGQAIGGQPIPGNGVMSHVQLLAQDPEAKGIVKQLTDQLGKAMNEVKGMAQRLQQQQQAAQQNGNGKLDPKDAAKIKATQLMAQVKADNQSKSQAQRAAQRQLQFQREMKEREQSHAQTLRHQHAEKTHELAATRATHKSSLGEE